MSWHLDPLRYSSLVFILLVKFIYYYYFFLIYEEVYIKYIPNWRKSMNFLKIH